MGIVAVIPAKMTSKRLPGKNLRSLCERPLIFYSIRVAQLVESIEGVYVSSESERILTVAESFGARAVMRPEKLSRPNVTNIEVLKHCHSVLSQKPEIVILLQPTHPIRDPQDIIRAIELFKASDADALFSLVRTEEMRGTVENGLFKPEVPLPRRKQQEPERFKNTGSFYFFRPELTFLTGEPFGKRILPYVLSRPELEIDIDSSADLKMAECLLRTYADQLPHFDIS
jgi:CMP-N-acetylneuraminic acid synthetase